MIQRKSLTKVTFLLLAGGVISLAGIQTVTASPDKGGGIPCPTMMGQNGQMSEDMVKIRDAFLQDSKELRKSMMVKRAQMRAMMQATNPDPEKVSVLAGEIFDLREQLREKAIKNGLPGHAFMGPMSKGMGMRPGCNMMQKGGPMTGGAPHHQQ